MQYKTRQRDLLIQFAESTKGSHFTVEDVRKHFEKNNETVGTATIYRWLEKMVCEHFLNKYIIDEKSAACFEYTGETPKTEKPHFHLKCESCGQLIHLHCEELEGIQNHILEEHGFSVDSFRTVFYGLCKNCRDKVNK